MGLDQALQRKQAPSGKCRLQLPAPPQTRVSPQVSVREYSLPDRDGYNQDRMSSPHFISKVSVSSNGSRRVPFASPNHADALQPAGFREGISSTGSRRVPFASPTPRKRVSAEAPARREGPRQGISSTGSRRVPFASPTPRRCVSAEAPAGREGPRQGISSNGSRRVQHNGVWRMK